MRTTFIITTTLLSLGINPLVPAVNANDLRSYKDVARRHADYLRGRQIAAAATITTTLAPTPAPVTLSVPPLSSITSGDPTESTLPLPTVYTAGASPPISGAPPLPSSETTFDNTLILASHFAHKRTRWLIYLVTVDPANYPTADVVPPTDSPVSFSALPHATLSVYLTNPILFYFLVITASSRVDAGAQWREHS
jgi:hypothetical protein